MGLLGNIIKTTFDIAFIPVAIIKDTVTMGGALTDESEPYTLQKIKDVAGDANDVINDLYKL